MNAARDHLLQFQFQCAACCIMVVRFILAVAFHAAIGAVFAITAVLQTRYIDSASRFCTAIVPGTALKIIIYHRNWPNYRVNVLFTALCSIHFVFVFLIVSNIDRSWGVLAFTNIAYSFSNALYSIYYSEFTVRSKYGRYIFLFVYNLRLITDALNEVWTTFELYSLFIVITVNIVHIFRDDRRRDSEQIVIIHTVSLVVDTRETLQYDCLRSVIVDYMSLINEVINLTVAYSFGLLTKLYPDSRCVYYTSCIVSMMIVPILKKQFSIKLNGFLLMFRLCFLIAMLLDRYSVPVVLFYGIIGLMYYVHDISRSDRKLVVLKSIIVDIISLATLLWAHST